MDYLPESVQNALEGPIDPHSQYTIETHSQTFFIALTAVSFLISYFSQSVLLGLEVFTGGVILLLLVAVPAWPYLRRHPITFLSVRKLKAS